MRQPSKHPAMRPRRSVKRPGSTHRKSRITHPHANSPNFLRTTLLMLLWSLPLLGVLWILHQAPAWLEPRLLWIELAPGQSAILGHNRNERQDDLWSPIADAEHIRLLRTEQGKWQLENIATAKQVLWKPQGVPAYQRVREWRLSPNGQFSVGQQSFTVTAVSAKNLTLESDGHRWHYDGTQLVMDDQPLPPCNPGWSRQMLNKLSAHFRPQTLHLGGGVWCATRLGMPHVEADALKIVPVEGGFVLRPGSSAQSRLAVQVSDDAGNRTALRERIISLNQGDQLIIGYTGYRVMEATDHLALAITGRGQRWLATESLPETSQSVQVTLAPLSLLLPEQPIPLLIRLILAMLIPLLMLPWLLKGLLTDSSRTVRIKMSLCLSLAAGSGQSLWNEAMPVLWSYALAWLALLCLLWMVRGKAWSALLTGLLTVLLGWGLVTQLQLGIGAEESRWLRYGNSTAALFGSACWLLLAGLIGFRNAATGWPDKRWAKRILAVLSGGALLLLMLQAALGNEAGWGGFQPFEFAKLALLLSVASALALRAELRGWDLTYPKLQLWWRYLGSSLILVILVMFALVVLRDFSPLVLLLLGGLVLIWAYLRTHQDRFWRWSGQGVLAIVAIAIVLGVVQLRQHPDWFPEGLQNHRVQVWAAPERYPHAGYQLRQALEEIRAGGWWGVNAGVIRGNAYPGENGRVITVPAIQDDFAPAFFLNRFGGVAAVILLAVQILLLLTLFQIGERALMLARQNDYRKQAWGWFTYFALWGGSGLLAAHFLVSWGTNLGFLPVMGQPMPLLSAGGSHLILFVCPIVMLALVIEELQTPQKK